MKEKDQARAELQRLCAEHTTVSEKGFAVDLRQETEAWHSAIRSLGRSEAYRLMSDFLCESYQLHFGRPFLFDEGCVAFEIAYHADTYFWACGLKNSSRHITTLLFKRTELLRHCEVIDISTDDILSFRQRAMFDYAASVRPCYRSTPADPFAGKRHGLLTRFSKPSK